MSGSDNPVSPKNIPTVTIPFAREADRVLITTDRDFLDPDLSAGLRVLLVSADDAGGEEIAGLAWVAEEPTELHRVT